jgi:hypothetical protein
MRTTVDTLAGVAAHGLLGTRLELPSEPPPDGQFDSLLRQLDSHRLLGLAASAASTERLLLTDEQRQRLNSEHLDAMCACLHLEATLLDAHAAFSSAGVDFRVVKGPAAAHLDYADPALRPFGDLDVIVRSEQFDVAKSVLEESGYRRLAPEPRTGFDRRFGKGATYVAEDGTNVDLHRTFVMGPLGLRVRLDDVWATTESFSLAGTTLEGLIAEHRLLAACYNAIVGDRSPRLSTLRDIAQLALSGDVDTDRVVATAAGWHGQHVLARGVRTTWETLQLGDVTALSAWAERYEPDPAEVALLAIYHDSAAGYSGLSWATARMLRPVERVAFLRALAFPRGGRLGKRGWGLAQRAKRAARGYRRTAV